MACPHRTELPRTLGVARFAADSMVTTNDLLLYSPARGVAYGRLYKKGKTTLLRAPSPAMTAELETLWTKEFRQQ
jgi:hypothetical protein